MRIGKPLLVPLVLEVALVLAPGCSDDEVTPIDAAGPPVDAIDAPIDTPVDVPIDTPDPPPMD